MVVQCGEQFQPCEDVERLVAVEHAAQTLAGGLAGDASGLQRPANQAEFPVVGGQHSDVSGLQAAALAGVSVGDLHRIVEQAHNLLCGEPGQPGQGARPVGFWAPLEDHRLAWRGIPDPVFGGPGGHQYVLEGSVAHQRIGETERGSVEVIDGPDQRRIGPMVHRHPRGRMHRLSQRAVAGQVGTPEAVNALLGVSDDQERLGVGVFEEPLEHLDLQGIAVLALIEDGRFQSAPDRPGHRAIGALGVERIADRQQDVVEGPDTRLVLASRQVGPDALGQSGRRELFFRELQPRVSSPKIRERRGQIFDLRITECLPLRGLDQVLDHLGHGVAAGRIRQAGDRGRRFLRDAGDQRGLGVAQLLAAQRHAAHGRGGPGLQCPGHPAQGGRIGSLGVGFLHEEVPGDLLEQRVAIFLKLQVRIARQLERMPTDEGLAEPVERLDRCQVERAERLGQVFGQCRTPIGVCRQPSTENPGLIVVVRRVSFGNGLSRR